MEQKVFSPMHVPVSLWAFVLFKMFQIRKTEKKNAFTVLR